MLDLTLGEAGPENSEEIAAFLGVPDPEVISHEYWGHLPERSVFVIARQDGRLVGTQGFIPYALNVEGRPILTGRADRTRVSEDFRGGVLFPKMMDLCVKIAKERGLQFMWAHTTALKAFQRVGFLRFTGYFEHAITCLNPRGLFRMSASVDRKVEYLKRLTPIPSCLLRGAGSLVHLAKSSSPGCEVLREAKNIDDVRVLYQRIGPHRAPIVIEQDDAYQSWLSRIKERQLLRFFGYQGEVLMAYVYIDVSSRDLAVMVDFGSGDGRGFRAVLAEAREELSRLKVDYLRTAYNVTNPYLRSLSHQLLSCGFVPFLRRGAFVVRPITYIDLNILGSLENWCITPLWSLL